MSFLWISLIAFCVALTVAFLLIAILLFSPVVFIIETRNRAIRVRWLGILEFLVPLPGADGHTRFSIAGRPFRLEPREKKREPEKEEPISRKQPRTRAGIWFLWRCLRNASIRGAVARQFANLGKRLLRSLDLARFESNISMPDPAANGMLAGTLALSHLGRAIGIRVNFTGENSLFCEVRLYPYRVARAFAFFAFGLPYRAIFSEWRAAAR